MTPSARERDAGAPPGQAGPPAGAPPRAVSAPAADPSLIDPDLDGRAVSFENPTGGRGAGGTAHGGRKGSPSRDLAPGERIVLADIDGPGVIRRLWIAYPPAPPEQMRALWLEVFYDGSPEPSVSAPCLDFFGLPHGRPAPVVTALTAAQEGMGFNAYLPMPFARHVRVELTNSWRAATTVYYQIDYTLQAGVPEGSGYLHVSFRQENPTVLRRDFVIADGFRGPGRYLGCNVGIRVIDPCAWYGEGEVKIYRDGDRELPTICGTGLEDYVGSAWGLGEHQAPFGGAPLIVADPQAAGGRVAVPDFAAFYRWHLPDPVMFRTELRVTIQQIGAAAFLDGQEDELARYSETNPPAGSGWHRNPGDRILAWGLAERVDDYCATAYVYCREPQPVPRLDIAGALADIGRRPYEQADPMEAMVGLFAAGSQD